MRESIFLANDQDLTEVQQFWYRIYVAEMQRHISDPLTDHDSKSLHDPLACVGDLFIARDEHQQVIATLMTTIATNDLGKYEHLYGIDRLSANDRARASITTKLMVAPTYRKTRVPMLIATTTYRHLLSCGIDTDYIDCNDHLVEFFLRLGYKPHRGRINHQDYGAVNSMVLQLRDATHMESVGSPLLKHLQDFNQQANQKSKEASHAA
ncbi:MAG: hypothetical protein AB8B93_20795 [Pseudomonadales bacterium]